MTDPDVDALLSLVAGVRKSVDPDLSVKDIVDWIATTMQIELVPVADVTYTPQPSAYQTTSPSIGGYWPLLWNMWPKNANGDLEWLTATQITRLWHPLTWRAAGVVPTGVYTHALRNAVSQYFGMHPSQRRGLTPIVVGGITIESKRAKGISRCRPCYTSALSTGVSK
jgi:hypothetical protein